MKKYILIMFLPFFIKSSCKKEGECPASTLDKGDDRLMIKNNYGKQITYTFSYKFPDTSLVDVTQKLNGDVLNANPIQIIDPDENLAVRIKGCWETVFESQVLSGKLQIYVFDAEIVRNNSWETIRDNYLVLKRYEYSLENLRSMNWQVVY